MNATSNVTMILDRLAAEFRVDERRDTWFAVRREHDAALAATGYGPTSDGELRVSSLSGRKPLHELVVRSGDRLETWIVRRFSHGGLLRFVTGRRFADPTRPFREIVAAAHLERAGVATPRIVAARARRASVVGWELDLVTRRVDDAVDLGWVLGGVRRGEIDRACLPVLCAALGLVVRRMHDVGFLHADLTPNNVLVNRAALDTRSDAGAEPRLVVLDLDRARYVVAATDEDRRDNLRRLYRFVARREERDGRVLGRDDYARFFKAYDPSGRTWKDDWRAVERAHARAGAFHGVGWALESAFGKGRDVRERT